MRRLALIGAGALSSGAPEARAALERPGVRPATRDLLAALVWLDGASIDAERRGTRALERVRGGP